MKIKSSLKSLKKRDLNSKLVRRRGIVFMDNENHKSTWNNFTKFVLWGTVAVIGVLVLMAIFLL
jgi:ribosomal protein L36